jgi:RNA polymerase sigma factor (sigma-70 family)
MTDASDMELMREFARNHSEAAFTELVRRHLNLVYSIARRWTGCEADAEDVAQAVFVIFARKAAGLRPRTVLTGWLYETTRHTAACLQRTNIRRQVREQESYMQSALTDNAATDADWRLLAPYLEAAMSQLGTGDRTLLALRFYENKSGQEAAALLGIKEAAAHKRTARALEKLRKFFTRRGVVLSAAAIAGAVSANSVQAAPVALAKSVTAVAIAKGAAASGSTLPLVKGALKIMAWTKAKTVIAVSAWVLLTVGTVTPIMIYNQAKPVPGLPKDWSVLSGNVDQWNWADGKINARSTTGDSLLASSEKYGNVTLSVIAGTTNRDADIALRLQDADNGYFVLYVPNGTPWAAENGSFVGLMRRTAGDEVTLASYHGRGISEAGPSAKITVTAKGPWIEVRLNGVTVLRTKDATFSSGFIGLRICGDPNKPCAATFSNLTFH